jgi:hypothetical protein
VAGTCPAPNGRIEIGCDTSLALHEHSICAFRRPEGFVDIAGHLEFNAGGHRVDLEGTFECARMVPDIIRRLPTDVWWLASAARR